MYSYEGLDCSRLLLRARRLDRARPGPRAAAAAASLRTSEGAAGGSAGSVPSESSSEEDASSLTAWSGMSDAGAGCESEAGTTSLSWETPAEERPPAQEPLEPPPTRGKASWGKAAPTLRGWPQKGCYRYDRGPRRVQPAATATSITSVAKAAPPSPREDSASSRRRANVASSKVMLLLSDMAGTNKQTEGFKLRCYTASLRSYRRGLTTLGHLVPYPPGTSPKAGTTLELTTRQRRRSTRGHLVQHQPALRHSRDYARTLRPKFKGPFAEQQGTSCDAHTRTPRPEWARHSADTREDPSSELTGTPPQRGTPPYELTGTPPKRGTSPYEHVAQALRLESTPLRNGFSAPRGPL